MSHLFTSDDQKTGASASASVLPVDIQGWSPLRLPGLISLLPKGLSGAFSSTTVPRHLFFGILPFSWSSSHNCTWPLGKPLPWWYGPMLDEWCLCFSTQCLVCHGFPAKKNHLLISWLQSPSAVISEPKKRKSVTTSTFPPFYLPWSNGAGCYDLSFFFNI